MKLGNTIEEWGIPVRAWHEPDNRTGLAMSVPRG
jgi:hypothetical protein